MLFVYLDGRNYLWRIQGGNMSCTYLIVGEEYAGLTKYDSVLTATELLVLINNSQLKSTAKLIIGQGVESDKLDNIITLVGRLGNSISDSVTNIIPVDKTHKSNKKNVLITNMKKSGLSKYFCSLLINNTSDRLSDHVTGYHVGAMLLIEAARQATIYILDDRYNLDEGKEFGLVMSKFNTEFMTYCFPVEVNLEMDIEEISNSVNRILTAVSIDFYQGKTHISKMSMNVELVKSRVLDKIENKQVKKCISEITSNKLESDQSLASLQA